MTWFPKAAILTLLFASMSTITTQASAETSLTKLLPQSIRDSGVLRVIASPSTPPMLFVATDGRQLQGMEVELTQALADALGVKLDVTQGTFDSLIPSIAANRADMAVGSIGDLKSRQSQVDFIDYVKAGVGMAAVKGNGAGINGLADLCGKKVAVVRGTFQEHELANQQTKCQASGSPLEIQSFTDTPSAILALRSGRSDIWSGDTSQVAYAVKQYSSALETVGKMRTIALLGFSVSKQNKQLSSAIKAALDELLADGKYKQILEKWGQGDTMVEKITVNDAWL